MGCAYIIYVLHKVLQPLENPSGIRTSSSRPFRFFAPEELELEPQIQAVRGAVDWHPTRWIMEHWL